MNINIETIDDKNYVLLEDIFTITKKYKERIKKLETEIKEQEEYTEYWQSESDKKQNIIDIIREIFNNLDNHFEDDCDCEKIELLLESLDDYEN